MKTLRKAFWGIFFLVPLFLPSQTKAGPFEDWYRAEFGTPSQTMGNPNDRDPYEFNRPTEFDRRPVFDRRSDFGRHYGQQNDYRPYNPWADRHDPAGTPGTGADPGSPNSVPIDGGLVFLMVAGLGLGALKMYGIRKRSETAVA
jgi:hypothetical protein